MPCRNDRHPAIAEADIAEHKALTAAKPAGRNPRIARLHMSGEQATFFRPQGGDQLHPDGISWHD